MTLVEQEGETVKAPREDLIRMTTTLRHQEEGNLLVGLAAVWDEWTEIDSWEGKFRERIARGAFRKTLKDQGEQVKVLFNHGMDPSIGDKPLGKPRVMREDEQGLYVEVPLDDTSYNQDIKALLRSGALDGMSFRMTVVRDQWTGGDDDTLPERTIREVKLYEFGPVTFPAYKATQAGVRAHAPRAFEAWRSATGAPEVPTPHLDEVDEGESPPDEPVLEATLSTTDEPPAPEHPSQEATPTRQCSVEQKRRQADLATDYMQLILRRSERYS